MPKRKTHEEFMEDFKSKSKRFNEIEVIGIYNGSLNQLKCKCKIHDYIWYPKPAVLLLGCGCKYCGIEDRLNSTSIKTHDDFINAFYKNDISKNIDTVSQFINTKTDMIFKCKIHNIEFSANPYSLITRYKFGCPICIEENKTDDINTYLHKLEISNKDVLPLEDYIRYREKILHKCLICNYEFSETPSNILMDDWKCNSCYPNSHNLVVGVNDMWSTAPHIAKLLMHPEDGYKYTKSSSVKLSWKCPDCGNVINDIAIHSVYTSGKVSCGSCSDGLSIPNKFMMNILIDLNVVFEREQKFKWCKFIFNNKNKIGIYDFSFNINKNFYLIEMDGKFHDFPHNKSGLTLEESKFIDSEKDRLAQENGYEIIRIDCMSSELEYIKNNILSSKLNDIMHLSIVDWEECYKKSMKSIMIEVCNMWKDYHNIIDISNIVKVGKGTIRKYLKRGAILGLCDYDTKQLHENFLSTIRKKVRCIDDNKIYNSMLEASIDKNMHRTAIKQICEGTRIQIYNVPPKYNWEYVN